MHVRLAELARVGHDEPRIPGDEHAAVADLAAALGVERRRVEDHLALLARAQCLHRILAAEKCHDAAAAALVLVAGEGGLALDRDAGAQVDPELARRPRPGPLLLHRRLEPGLVDREATLARDVVRQVHREAEGVVQAEDRLARNLLARQLADRAVEQRHALRERLGEALLFLLQHALDVRALRAQLGIRVAHFLVERGHDLVEERLALAEHEAVADRAADDPAQHVAAALVRGQHAVGDQERARADVVGDHAQRGRLAIGGARHLGGRRRSAAGTGRSRSCCARPASRRRCARGPCPCRPRASAAASSCRRPSGRTA